MAKLNQLLAEKDLAKLSFDQREFLVQRIDHMMSTSPEINEIIARGLESSLRAIGSEASACAD